MSRRTEITAVHEDDARAFLEKVGLSASYESRKLTCMICGEPLLDAGLGAARFREGDLVFTCRKLECMETFHDGG